MYCFFYAKRIIYIQKEQVDKAIVITTINSPKSEILSFAAISDWKLIIVGDRKTPKNWSLAKAHYLSPSLQDKLFPKFSKTFPWNLYARKNIGYLYAIKNKAKVIYESDDDMFPNKNFPPPLDVKIDATVLSGKKFINVINFFLKERHANKPVWTRGFPLEYIKNQEGIIAKKQTVFAPLRNSVQDKDSDFDAIYRFLYNEQLSLKKNGLFALDVGCYAPVNTQSTFSHPPAYPLLYLPATSGSRVEDIYRGYIAQRILWEMGSKLLFTYPVAGTSKRNPHNTSLDFALEIPNFVKIIKLTEVLNSLSLPKDPLISLLKVYKELIKRNFLQKIELKMVEAWAFEIEKIL